MQLAKPNQNYLFGQLPHYFKENDSYVRNDIVGYENQGFLERYLEAFCLEYDQEVDPYIENIGHLYNALGLDNLPMVGSNKFITHLSDMLDNPPDIGTDEQYKILLRYLTHILRVRGTRLGLNLYLAIFGYRVDNLITTPYETAIYDDGFKYDDGWIYDGEEIFFFDVDLVITDYEGINSGNPGSTWLALLKQALQNYIMPVITELKTVTYVQP